jgi:hypothetical protein
MSLTIQTPTDGALRIIGAFVAVDLNGQPVGTVANIIAETTTARTLALTDAGAFITTTSGSTTTVTVPANASVAFATGTQISFAQLGSGQLVFTTLGIATIFSKAGNLKVSAQYAGAVLTKTGTNTWLLVGDLTA